MKPETILKKLDETRKAWLKRIAWRLLEAGMLNDYGNFRHASWSSCVECVAVKRNALASIQLVRSLR